MSKKKATTTITIKVSDLDRLRLLMWELRMLYDDLRACGDNERARRIQRMMHRFASDDDD